MNPPSGETYAACLTPPGVGAIACLGVRGPRAWGAVRELFRPHAKAGPGLPPEPVPGRVWLGWLGAEAADEVIVAVKEGRPVPWVEVHCHGGQQAVRLIQEALEARGVRSCSWQDFQRQASPDPVRSAALAALAQAPTLRTAAILLDQYEGAFARAVEAILAAWDRGRPEGAGRLLEPLARYARLGRHLTTPWRVIVAGAVNVGKSSLVNALAGYPRCVVADTPGTTRDLVSTAVAVDGWPLELVDTAGLRAVAEGLEGQGIGLARAAATAADLCLWVLDASAPPAWPDFEAASVRFVLNKVDLPPGWDPGRAGDAVPVSARTGAGLPELCCALSRWLVPEPPPPGVAVPFNEPLCALVEKAWSCYQAGQAAESRLVLQAALEHAKEAKDRRRSQPPAAGGDEDGAEDARRLLN